MANAADGSLTTRQLWSYALTEMPLQMAMTPIALFIIPYYTRDLALSLFTIGLFNMLARMTDVVFDPMIGQLSDRTRTKFGRRKPWIMLGVPVMVLSVWMLFVPAPNVTEWYFLFWLVMFWLGWTLINIPYYAWGAEISSSYHERTRIASLRTSFGLAGTLTGMLLPLISGWLWGYGYALGESLHIIGGMAVGLLLVASVMLWRLPEAAPVETRRISLWTGVRVMWGNGPFKRLMLGFTIAAIGPAIGGPLYLLFVIYVLKEPNLTINTVLLVFYASNLLAVMFWRVVARRVGKRNAWLMGMCVALIAQPGYLLLGPGDVNLMLGVLALLGVGIGSFAAIPAAMKADVVDLDRLRSGEDRTGLFFSVWSSANKLAVAVGGFVATTLVSWSGFKGYSANTPEQIEVLRMVFCVLPMFFYIAAFAVIWKYPISEARHLRLIGLLQRRVARKARAASAADATKVFGAAGESGRVA